LTSIPLAAFLHCTVGVHPCTSTSFDTHPAGVDDLLQSLKALALSASTPASPIVAFGEIGLDYDRLSHAPASTQLKYFRAQLDLLTSLPVEQRLPLFLHSRAAAVDFAAELRSRLDLLPKRGVVHSFTGTVDEMMELVDMGFDIGINGCSLKTIENCDVVRAVPLSHIQIETDGPWCEMRAAHASSHYISRDYKPKNEQGETVERISDEDEGIAKDILETEARWKWVKKEKWVEGALVKGRNEPCMVGRVVVAVARIKGCSVKEVADAALGNSVRMFGLE
jgi:TatD DNase family protein